MKRTLVIATASIALALAGCGGDDEESSTTPAAADTDTGTTTEAAPAPAGGGKSTKLEIAADAGGALKFDKTSLSAKAGDVTIAMDNPSSVPHGVGVEGSGVDEEGEIVEKGGVSKVSVDLKPGTYEYYCPVGNHEQAGMKGTLTVN